MEHYTIATVAEKNPDFRRVLWTGKHTQLVVMTIPPGGEIGEEVHEVDQILTFVSGTGEARVSGQTRQVAQGDLVVVPAGRWSRRRRPPAGQSGGAGATPRASPSARRSRAGAAVQPRAGEPMPCPV